MTDDPPRGGSDGLRVGAEVDGATARLTLVGAVDAATAPRLRAALDDALAAGAGELEVDVRGVTFLDSSGLNVLVVARNGAQRLGGTLRLVGAGDEVRRLLRITDLLDLLAPDG